MNRKPRRPRTTHHFRFYHYVRMMLRRYPKMQWERSAVCSNAGVAAICGTTTTERRDAAIKRHAAKLARQAAYRRITAEPAEELHV